MLESHAEIYLWMISGNMWFINPESEAQLSNMHMCVKEAAQSADLSVEP